MRKFVKWLFALFMVGLIIIVLVIVATPSLGGSAMGKRLERMKASPHFHDGSFNNPVAEESWNLRTMGEIFSEQLLGKQKRVPSSAIPVLPILTEAFSSPCPPGLRVIWFGHSSVLIELDGSRLFIDPVLSLRASPVSFLGPRRFHPPPMTLNSLPPIDAVLISHDHYDHLEMETVTQLAGQGSRFYVPLGVGAHLRRWNIPEDQIVELDWGESHILANIRIVSTPAYHYSGRRLIDYNKTFWCSFALIGPEHRVFYSGDGGYGDHFRAIGDQWGPFDLTLMKVGSYGPSQAWLQIHMDPESAVAASRDLRGLRMIPLHWGTFNLGIHAWDEPIRRTVKAATKDTDLITPMIGEIVKINQLQPSKAWWENLE